MAEAGRQHFQTLISSGRPVGEVISVNSSIVTVKGLQPVNSHSVVVFEDGSTGFVQQILEDYVVIMHLAPTNLRAGMMVTVESTQLTTNVGKAFIGRVVSTTGEPLDGKGAIAADSRWPIFNSAPPINERELLDTQMETGIFLIDALFPITRGQRMALLGDSKSGKTTMATQIAINQRDTDQVVVYAMIAKKPSDVSTLLERLETNGAMDKAIVVVSTIFESLVNSYLAPYVACALGEYLWQVENQDTVIIYDDLMTHAFVYRELALLSRISPGRDSYPGDMFYTHSSLLERAGKLARNHKHQTLVPIVLASGGDITAYLPSNIMSITDGQWILDMEVFNTAWRPAVNTGLSVSRVGGVGYNKRQKQQNDKLLKLLESYNKAREFSRFGSEAAVNMKPILATGEKVKQLFNQLPGETYTLMAQQLLLDIILESTTPEALDIAGLKKAANQAAGQVKTDEDFAAVKQTLQQQTANAPAAPPPAAPTPAPPANPAPTGANRAAA